MSEQFGNSREGLRLPCQSPPVLRSLAACQLQAGAGVVASVDWDALAAAAGTFLNGLASLMGSQTS